MTYTIELLLAGLSVLGFAVFIYWDLRLQASINRGERTHLKRRDLDARHKTFSLVVLAYLALTLYVGIASFFSFSLNTSLPLDWIGFGSGILFAMEAAGFAALAYVLSYMNPLKKPSSTSP